MNFQTHRSVGARRLLACGMTLFASAALAGCGGQTSDSGTGGAPTPSGSAAGGAPGAKKEYLIGMSQANKGEPWRQAMNDQIAAAAKAHPEFKVVFADAAQNNAKQVADVENFLQQGIDLLIISPNEAAPLTDVVAKVHAKGIPVILLDRKVKGDKFTMFIGADNVKIGEKAGQYVAKWCSANGGGKPCNVLEIRGLEGTSGTKERGDGFRKGIASNPKVKIIASQNADWLREKAIPVSQAMLQANSDVQVIYGHNDPMAEAAVISAQNAKRDKKIVFVGVDALPTPDGGIKSVMDGRLSVTYVYPTGGKEAIDWAAKILEQKAKPPKSVILPTEEVTKASAPQIYQKYGGK